MRLILRSFECSFLDFYAPSFLSLEFLLFFFFSGSRPITFLWIGGFDLHEEGEHVNPNPHTPKFPHLKKCAFIHL